jgi:hypothetical protein
MEKMYQRCFKKNDIVVYGQNQGLPQFGRILNQESDSSYNLCILRTTTFARNLHCYKVAETGQTIVRRATDFIIFDGMRLYHGSYVRLPYALFCKSSLFF